MRIRTDPDSDRQHFNSIQFELTYVEKVLSAVGALEGLLAPVDVEVGVEGDLVVEGLATAGAGVRLALVHLKGTGTRD